MLNKKIENSIVMHYQTIEELKELKEKVQHNPGNKVRFRIETKCWYGYDTPFLLKERSIIDLSDYTMNLILDEAINKERERIDKLIDMQIEKRRR